MEGVVTMQINQRNVGALRMGVEMVGDFSSFGVTNLLAFSRWFLPCCLLPLLS